ncbi:hypothetical protein [Paenibacillus hexagrammi]|uniref:Uncharacterized protein n=1 Tax=Paenibacillus hexagrammi TaxID=2908839 RepID=A0ABY3SJZ5_9BACL|nr:hypothetical protein [Paenibacillus sp. YPD9-1]UJF34286.1 hypothetical protein L0M14_03475 [Paenibacillus sp. YPD9-1]
MKGTYIKWIFILMLSAFILAISPWYSHAADDGITIIKQSPGVVGNVRGTFEVRVLVYYNYPITRVTAQLDSISEDLVSVDSETWQAQMDISSLGKGIKNGTITATDNQGHIATIPLRVNYDDPPTLAVQQPDSSSITTGDVHVQMTCSDDSTLGCQKVTLEANGKQIMSDVNTLDTVISLSEYDGKLVTLKFTGYDSAGQRIEEKRNVYVDSNSSRLTLLSSYPNARLLDFDSDRVLLLQNNNFEIRDLHSCHLIASIPNSLNSLIKEGRLTANGAIIKDSDGSDYGEHIYEWIDEQFNLVLNTDKYTEINNVTKIKGNYLLYIKDGLVLRNLLTRNEKQISQSKKMIELLQDGTAIYEEDGVIKQYKEDMGASLLLTPLPDYQLIGSDGTTSVFLKELPRNESSINSQYSILLHNDDGDRELGITELSQSLIYPAPNEILVNNCILHTKSAEYCSVNVPS